MVFITLNNKIQYYNLQIPKANKYLSSCFPWGTHNPVLVCRIFNHPNVLPVLGTCNQPPHLVVISQFMQNGSLYDVIHGESGTLTYCILYIGKN